MVARGWGREAGAFLLNERRVSTWEDEKVLEMSGSEGYTTTSTYLMPPNLHFQMVNYITQRIKIKKWLKW